MLKQRVSAVHSVANTFLPAEKHINQAALDAARCVVIMLEQHEAANLPLRAGADAIVHAARTAALLAEARQSAIRTHGALDAALKDIGLAKMYGKTSDNPENEPSPFTGASLAPGLVTTDRVDELSHA